MAHAETPAQVFSGLLRRLHLLIADGKGDSEEADRVREEMEAPWLALSREERDFMAHLSVKLYFQHNGV